MGSWHKRFNYLTILATLTLIVSFAFIANPFIDQPGHAGPMINPGPLSTKHEIFTDQQSCQNCHNNHHKKLLDWFLSAFKHQDLSSACTQCHLFAGSPLAPHQNEFDNNNTHTQQRIECVRCHTEHQGKSGNITPINNITCSNCHKKSFSLFANKNNSNTASQHTEFDKNYPYQQKQNIYFDHLKHIDQYFVEEQYLTHKRDVKFAQLAAQSCTTCHDIQNAIREVKPQPYAKICKGCHDNQIMESQLTLLSTDLEIAELSPIAMSLLGTGDAEELAERVIAAIKQGEMKGLFNSTNQQQYQQQYQQQQQMWSGLNPIEAKVAVETWSTGEPYAPEIADKETTPYGWLIGEDTNGDEAIFYKAKGHADPTLKAWIEQLLHKSQNHENQDNEIITEALDILLDKQGPGACGKCHAAGLNANLSAANQNTKSATWGYKNKQYARHTIYSHKPHINLMGQKEGCDNCHIFNKKADTTPYFKHKGQQPNEYQAAFLAITKETCSECHTQEKIISDCTTCHRYHGPSSYKIGFMSKSSNVSKLKNQLNNQLKTKQETSHD
jgi:hypothetical protein